MAIRVPDTAVAVTDIEFLARMNRTLTTAPLKPARAMLGSMPTCVRNSLHGDPEPSTIDSVLLTRRCILCIAFAHASRGTLEVVPPEHPELLEPELVQGRHDRLVVDRKIGMLPADA